MITKYRVAVALILFISALLIFTELDHTSFWDDEAHISIVANNYIKTGAWTGWDGRNLLADYNGQFLTETLRHYILQLDYLTVTASFAVLGASTWAGRFPFALAGFAALIAFLVLLRREFPQQHRLQLFALACLALSVNFLLYVRTCRYYALSILFAILIYWAYRRYLQTKQFFYALFLVSAAALLFISSSLNGAAFLLAIVALHLRLHPREFGKREWAHVAGAIALFVLTMVPYVIVTRIWAFGFKPMGVEDSWFIRKPVLLWWNWRELNTTGYLPWVILIGLIYFLTKSRRENKDVSEVRTTVEWCFLSFAYVLFLSFLSPQPVSITNIADVRYLVPALPFLAGLIGVFLWFVHRSTPVGSFALFAVLICSNLLSLSPPAPDFRWMLPGFIQELQQPYPTAFGEVSQFLLENAASDETIHTYPPFVNYPVMFYVGDRLKTCCILTNKTHLLHNAIEHLRAPLWREKNYPQWFVAFGDTPEMRKELQYFSRPHKEAGANVAYSYRLVKTLDVYWDQTHRPEIVWHTFGPRGDFDKKREAVYVYRREVARP